MPRTQDTRVTALAHAVPNGIRIGVFLRPPATSSGLLYDGAMGNLHARAAHGGSGPGADVAAPDADRREPLRYEALRFPGCRRISLTRDRFEEYQDRIEYWDARSETAWILADKYGVHEGTSRRLPHLAERIASVRGTPIVSYGSVTLLVRDEAGEPRRAMEADETLYLHPTRSATPSLTRASTASVLVNRAALPAGAMQASRCVFEMSTPTVQSGIFSFSCACLASLHAHVSIQDVGKDGGDQTHVRP